MPFRQISVELNTRFISMNRIKQQNATVFPASVPVDAAVLTGGFLPTGAFNIQNAVTSQPNIYPHGILMSESFGSPGDLQMPPRYVLDDGGVSYSRSPVDFIQERQHVTGEQTYKF